MAQRGETPPDFCVPMLQGSFENGKVYVLNVSGMGGSAEAPVILFTVNAASEYAKAHPRATDLGKALSKLAYYESDLAAGRTELTKDADYWAECLKNATGPGQTLFGAAPNLSPGHARDRIEIPPPP